MGHSSGVSGVLVVPWSRGAAEWWCALRTATANGQKAGYSAAPPSDHGDEMAPCTGMHFAANLMAFLQLERFVPATPF